MIKLEIEKLMSDFVVDTETGEISAEFAFPCSFTGFSGHFPSNPILPGVCQIQCILVLLSAYYGKSLQLSSVSRAKFLNTVKPDELITLKGTCSETEDSIAGNFSITKESAQGIVKISKISLNMINGKEKKGTR